MMKKLSTCFLLLLVISSTFCFAQIPAISFEVISSKDGLPGNTVLTATRDHTGFMWFGTRQDIVRYNGATFQRYSYPETNFVTGVVADADNNIWLSSDRNGICRIDSHSLQMECMPIENQGNVETTGYFFIDRFGSGWYSDRSGVNRIDLKTHARKHYPFKQTNYVWTKASFVEDAHGVLWVIGRDNGLFRYDRAKDTMVCLWGLDCMATPAEETVLLSATSVADDDGTIWIGSYNAGLLHYNPATNTYDKYNTGRRSNQVISIAKGVDENGREIFWIGDDEGLGVFRPDQKQFYFFKNILAEPFEVNYIYRDPQDGIVWACTSAGIVKYNPLSNVIRSFMLPAGLVRLPVTINVVLQDNQYQNIIYLGLSHTGFVQWNKVSNEFTLIRYPESGDTRWMTQRPDGNLWIGTNKWDYKRPGVFIYNTEQEKFITTPQSITANKFYSVPFFMYGAFDGQGRLWLGNSDEGIHVVNAAGEEIKVVDASLIKDVLKNNNLINDFVLDAKQSVAWLATLKGVVRMDESSNEINFADPADHRQYIQDAAANSMLKAHDGTLWTARWGSLTNTGKDGKFIHVLTGQDGFVDRQIQGLTEDEQGNIWAGNYEGLYCYHQASQKLKRFTVNDGLINNNTIGRVFSSSDGQELYIGHQNGFNIISINRLLRPAKPATLGITSFKVHEKNKAVDFANPIILSPEENAFSVDFIALNYRKLHDNVYAYYLEGFEKDWNYSESHHQAYYTNLNPGRYTLHMRAGDVLGNWSPDTSKIVIEVLPAFYETLWFELLIVLLVVAMLYALYRYRINQLVRLQHVRNRISADLHDELGSSLSSISIMGTLAKKGMDASHPGHTFMERMMEEIHQISGSLDDIVWNISPRNDGLSSLIARMTRYAAELFEARKIQYQFAIPEHIEHIKLSMEQRRNFYLIFKETVNNLIKYSHCTHASITIQLDKRKIKMVIYDNGIGFDPTQPSDRNGIQNLKDRAASLKGTLQILSEAAQGTKVSLNFPVN